MPSASRSLSPISKGCAGGGWSTMGSVRMRPLALDDSGRGPVSAAHVLRVRGAGGSVALNHGEPDRQRQVPRSRLPARPRRRGPEALPGPLGAVKHGARTADNRGGPDHGTDRLPIRPLRARA